SPASERERRAQNERAGDHERRERKMLGERKEATTSDGEQREVREHVARDGPGGAWIVLPRRCGPDACPRTVPPRVGKPYGELLSPGRRAHASGDVDEGRKVSPDGVVARKRVGDAVDGRLELRLVCAEESVPQEEDATVILVEVARVDA